jgi:hypothetical protein
MAGSMQNQCKTGTLQAGRTTAGRCAPGRPGRPSCGCPARRAGTGGRRTPSAWPSAAAGMHAS